jgi:hypothetical protein
MNPGSIPLANWPSLASVVQSDLKEVTVWDGISTVQLGCFATGEKVILLSVVGNGHAKGVVVVAVVVSVTWVVVGGSSFWDDVEYGGGEVGAGGPFTTGVKNHPASAPAATTPAPAAIATAKVLPLSSVVVIVVAAVIGGASPVIERDVGV